MPPALGPVRQNGYVVHDLDAALDHWTRILGVGPFYRFDHVPIQDFRFRGEPSPVDVSIALANSGPLQIELIVQHDDSPSMYREFLAAGSEGLQHIAFWTERFDTALADAEKAGFRVAQSGCIGEGGRFVYFEARGHPGSVVELSEVSGPKGRFFEHLARTAETWDGSEPVRVIPAPAS